MNRLYSMMDLENVEKETEEEETKEETTEETETKQEETIETLQEDAPQQQVDEEIVSMIWNNMWRFLQTYKLGEDQWWCINISLFCLLEYT